MREESIVLKRLLDGLTLRATSVIVTIYGDIVVPRGGTLWMGTLIQICADLGLSETLVRTAVSRLVAAGQLSGVREGRRSYYQLADSAVAEFAEAAELLYGREQPADGWAIHRCELPTDIILKSAMARIGPDLYLRPRHRDETIAIPGLCFTADVTAGLDLLPDYVATLWDLDSLASGYRRFIDHFAAIEKLPQAGLDPRSAVAVRLLLVHLYRAVLLRDPRLPVEALPSDWPAAKARALFVRLYRELTLKADTHIAAHYENAEGFLPQKTPATELRLSTFS
ncbi:phenylacetic acid degradation operon negative regulatory protein [Ochrobactrum daejeonense]|uniref:Phenylacetic acid degradation operon negative regulatory protein n=1 Tax=Brucella daejeonensis TaxID=659015 RepID=A0A7W9AUM8_9HYPH|nr:PaaX family transcriptional regulator C-terminal domain-containing protein [Brucella daejeonensis]MBB5700747.1 phenylacetic acid degradation operon negative regulatory protein [Brucella daejeonensis]